MKAGQLTSFGEVGGRTDIPGGGNCVSKYAEAGRENACENGQEATSQLTGGGGEGARLSRSRWGHTRRPLHVHFVSGEMRAARCTRRGLSDKHSSRNLHVARELI